MIISGYAQSLGDKVGSFAWGSIPQPGGQIYHPTNSMNTKVAPSSTFHIHKGRSSLCSLPVSNTRSYSALDSTFQAVPLCDSLHLNGSRQREMLRVSVLIKVLRTSRPACVGNPRSITSHSSLPGNPRLRHSLPSADG
jgi:hypothetical protein